MSAEPADVDPTAGDPTRVDLPRPGAHPQWDETRDPVARTSRDDRATTVRVRPGLSWLALGVLELIVVLLGCAIDLTVSGRPGWGFDIALVVAAVGGALTVRSRDRLAAVVTPPIVGALSVFGAELYRHGWSGASRTALVVASTLSLLAPAIYLATALALVIVLLRRRGERRSGRGRRPIRTTA